jgi:hypothetical protein
MNLDNLEALVERNSKVKEHKNRRRMRVSGSGVKQLQRIIVKKQ